MSENPMDNSTRSLIGTMTSLIIEESSLPDLTGKVAIITGKVLRLVDMIALVEADHERMP